MYCIVLRAKCCLVAWTCTCRYLGNPQILSAADHSGTVDIQLFTQFGTHRDFRCIRVLNLAFLGCARFTLGFRFPKKYAHQNDPLNQGNLHELKLRLKIVRYPGIEVERHHRGTLLKSRHESTTLKFEWSFTPQAGTTSGLAAG